MLLFLVLASDSDSVTTSHILGLIGWFKGATSMYYNASMGVCVALCHSGSLFDDWSASASFHSPDHGSN